MNDNCRCTDIEQNDPHLTVVPLCRTLAYIAVHSSSLFTPYAEQIFEKACCNINGVRFMFYVTVTKRQLLS